MKAASEIIYQVSYSNNGIQIFYIFNIVENYVLYQVFSPVPIL